MERIRITIIAGNDRLNSYSTLLLQKAIIISIIDELKVTVNEIFKKQNIGVLLRCMTQNTRVEGNALVK